MGDVMKYTLTHGSHATREQGMCLLEAVAYIAGEPHSDTPECACPVLSAYGRTTNDVMGKGADGDALRARYLGDIAPLLVGTRSTRDVQQRRAYLLTDRAVRVIAPMALDAAGLHDAATLRALAPVTDAATARAARAATEATARAARAVAEAVAGAAAWAAVDAAEAARAAAEAAADAAADAAAYAAADAAEAADAAAYAAADAARAADPDTVWAAARQALIDAINLDTDTDTDTEDDDGDVMRVYVVQMGADYDYGADVRGVCLSREDAIKHARGLVTSEQWQTRTTTEDGDRILIEFSSDWIEQSDWIEITAHDTDTDNTCGTLPRKEQHMKSNIYTLLTVDPPTTSEAAISWAMQLGMAGDSLGEGIEAVVKLGDVVQAGALLALATPPDGNPFGLLPVDPADAEDWLVTSGEQADAASHAGGQCFITTGEALPVLVRLYMMACPPELAAKIQAKMG